MKPMRCLISGASLALALLYGQSLLASAGPPDEAARRAEDAAERAQKAAERAAEAAERAAERAARDAAEIAERQLEAANREQRATDKAAEDLARDLARQAEKSREAAEKAAADLASKQTSGGEGKSGSGDVQLASSSGTSGSSSPDTDGGSNSGSSGSGSSGSDSGSSGSGTSGSNSGSSGSGTSGSDSGSSGSGTSGSNSGSSNSGEDGEDGDEDDQQGVLQASQGDKLDRDEYGNAYRSDELVILSDDTAIIERARERGFQIIETSSLDLLGSVLVRVRRPEGLSSLEALQMLRANEPGSAAGYNYVYDLSGPPASAPKGPAPAVSAARGASATSAIVGVVDGFAADSVGGWKVERLVAGPARINHGDAVTAIILDDLKSYHAPSPNLLLIDVVPGNGQADVAAIILSLDKLVAKHAAYANISLAGPDHPALKLAIARTQKLGLTIVAAVGNAGPAAPPAFPAAYEGVIGVSAVDHRGQPYVYSARGEQVDVAARGVDEVVAGSLVPLSGTSYATPHVTAFLAARRPDAAGPPVEQLLVSAAQDVGAPGRDAVYGMGILDPGNALAGREKTRLASVDLPQGN